VPGSTPKEIKPKRFEVTRRCMRMLKVVLVRWGYLLTKFRTVRGVQSDKFATKELTTTKGSVFSLIIADAGGSLG
jgi:hypothetical protein